MANELDLTSPELPELMSGAQLLAYMTGNFPNQPVVDATLKEVAAAMDEYNATRAGYNDRNVQYRERVQTFTAQPQEKATLIAHTSELGASVRLAQEKFKKFEAAVVRWEQNWGSSGIRDGITQALTTLEAAAQRLLLAEQAIQSAEAPSELFATATQPGAESFVEMPQKRVRAAVVPD